MDDLIPKLDSLSSEELGQLIKTLEKLLKTKTAKKEQPITPGPVLHAAEDDLVRLIQPGLDNNLVGEVFEHLKTLDYHPNAKNPHSPAIFLYGEQSYCYNSQSAAVKPVPYSSNDTMRQLLEAVNSELNTSFNSMLINKYRDYKCHLKAHKDDEKCLDPTSPIATLSLGKTRKFMIYRDPDQRNPVKELTLTHQSLLVMEPGFQEQYRHAVAPGGKNKRNERGVRFSVTLRRLIPAQAQSEGTSTNTTVKPAEPSSTTHTTPTQPTLPDTLVFGSSLVKGLKAPILSKYSKTFKVFCNGGAHVNQIFKDVQKVRDGGEVDCSKVTGVFLLCGGNDVEGLKSRNDIRSIFWDFEDLLDITREVFPFAKINIISLLPRRTTYKNHIYNMYRLNNWLRDFCKVEGVRFVDVFTHYLIKSPRAWTLNNKLFNSGALHFSAIGDSVLAKVLIGVANSPRG